MSSIRLLYLEIEVECVEFGMSFEVSSVLSQTCELMMGKADVETLVVIGFSTYLANLFDGLDVGVVRKVIGEDDCDDEKDEKI
ncbi:hypothetical protein Tco_0356532 [Tanacetum coccineum]